MKKLSFFISMLFIFSYAAQAQHKDYKVVFDLTSRDSINQQSLLREMTLIKQGNPDAKLEAVIYGQGLGVVIKDQAPQPETIKKLLDMKDVSFKVCEIAMKAHNVDKSQLLPDVQTVPDGIYELASKQREGWAYIKIAH
jgi:intracellular sulfur oxidation DsrE/DsrF family protein